MSPVTHLLASWVIAAKTTDNPRDCRLVTLAGILPDADGLGLVADVVTPWVGLKPTHYYIRYHHYLLHGAFGAVVIALLMAAFARSRWRVALLSLLVFHLHLLCDLAGSRGPSPEDLWPIFYFGPFDKDPMWLWHGQWRLDAWRNRLLTVALFGSALWMAPRLGYSVAGVFSRRIDDVLIPVFRKWRAALAKRFAIQRNSALNDQQN
jgi:hypothetical protein